MTGALSREVLRDRFAALCVSALVCLFYPLLLAHQLASSWTEYKAFPISRSELKQRVRAASPNARAADEYYRGILVGFYNARLYGVLRPSMPPDPFSWARPRRPADAGFAWVRGLLDGEALFVGEVVPDELPTSGRLVSQFEVAKTAIIRRRSAKRSMSRVQA